MQAYQTQNLAVAVTLATCGVPFWQNERGEPVPVLNIYSPDGIREIRGGDGKPVYAGWSFEEAAEHAWKAGIPGRVTYCFQGTPLIEEILEGYNAQTEVMRSVEEAPESALSTSSGYLSEDPQTVARIACQLLSNRKKLREFWKVPVPMLHYPGETQTVEEGGKKVKKGSFRLVSLNASQATRDRLGL